MALLTVEDYEVATGGATLSTGEAGRCQYYIDFVSSYLETRTGIVFTKIVGSVERARADDYGEVALAVWPVTAVTKIHDVKLDYDLPTPDQYWDGQETLCGLYPRQLIDVTYDCGLDPVPKDLQGVALEAVKRGMATAPTGLTKKIVGDVTYQYGDMLSFSDKDLEIINNYDVMDSTMRLGEHIQNPGRFTWNGLPISNQGDYYWERW